MSLDVSHAESAYSAGSTKYEQWFARQDEQWNRPIIRSQLAVFISTLSEEQKIQFAPQIQLIKDRIGLKEKQDASTTIPRWEPSAERNIQQSLQQEGPEPIDSPSLPSGGEVPFPIP
jgi:hypothetical protein